VLCLVNGSATLRTTFAQPDYPDPADCQAVEKAAAEGSEQLTRLIESDPARFNNALLHLIVSGRRNVDFAAPLAAQGEQAFSALLPLLAESDEHSRLFGVVKKWQTPVLAQLLKQLESPPGKTRTGAERAVVWLVADRARAMEMFRLLQDTAPELPLEIQAQLAPLGWSQAYLARTAEDDRHAPATAGDIATLTAWLSSPRPHTVRWAINSLAELGPAAFSASDTLQAWLRPRLAKWDGKTTRTPPSQRRAVLPSVRRPNIDGPAREIAEEAGPLFFAAEGDLIHDALVALQRIDPNSPRVRDLIRQAMRKLRDPQRVQQWLAWLGASQDVDSIDLFIEELQYPDPVIRQTAAVALGRLGQAAAPAAESLRKAIDTSRAGSNAFQFDHHRSRRLLLPNENEPTDDASRLEAIVNARRYHPDEELVFRQAAEAALLAIQGQAVDFEHWLELGPQKFKGSAYFYFGAATPEASASQLLHWSVETRRRAVEVLSSRKDVPENLVETLLGQLNAPGIEVDETYRAALVHALERLRAQPALPTLLAIAASKQETDQVRAAAAWAAAQIAPNDPQVVDALIAVLADRRKGDSADVHTVAASVLGEMPAAAGRAEHELERLRREGSESTKFVAGMALGKLAALDTTKTERGFADRLKSWTQLTPAERMALLRQLQELVEHARTAAKFDPADPQPLPRESEVVPLLPLLLVAYSQSTEKDERFWLLNLMNRIGPESTPEHVQAILDAEAYGMLESLHVSDRTTLKMLVERYEKLKARTDLTHTGEHWVLRGIARYGIDARPVALEVLRELEADRMADERYFGVFEARVDLVVAVVGKTPGVCATLVDLLNTAWPTKHQSQRIKVLQAFGRLGPPPQDREHRARFVAGFEKCLKDEDQELVLAAADSLQAFATHLTDKERRALVPGLLTALNQNVATLDRLRYYVGQPLRTSVIRLLGSFGSSAEDAVPLLEKMVADHSRVAGRPRPPGYSRRDTMLAREAAAALEKIRGGESAE
jgi:hypothetical protein